jgi:hypothetical protein
MKPLNNDILLRVEKDKTNALVQVMHSPELGLSKAYSLFLRSYADLIDRGHAFPLTMWDDEQCGILYAIVDNKIVAFIAYDKKNPQSPGGIWIVMEEVIVDYRKRGILQLLQGHFVELTKKLGFSYQAAHVHIDNARVFKNGIDQETISGFKPVFCFIKKEMYK